MITTDIVDKIRACVADFEKNGVHSVIYTGSNIFILPEERVKSVTSVQVNGSVTNVSYAYDEDTNAITVSSSISMGDPVVMLFKYYPRFSDTELTGYLKAALVELSIAGIKDFEIESGNDEIYPEPANDEADLAAGIAAILAVPNYQSIKMPNMTIVYNGKKSKREMIKDLVDDFTGRRNIGYSQTLTTSEVPSDNEE